MGIFDGMREILKEEKPKEEDVFKLPPKIKLLRKCNSLELRVEELEDRIKDDLFKRLMKEYNHIDKIEKLEKENKKLKTQIKELKRK